MWNLSNLRVICGSNIEKVFNAKGSTEDDEVGVFREWQSRVVLLMRVTRRAPTKKVSIRSYYRARI